MKLRKKQPKREDEQRLPELRMQGDRIAINGKRLRDRYEALRPYSDLKFWR